MNSFIPDVLQPLTTLGPLLEWGFGRDPRLVETALPILVVPKVVEVTCRDVTDFDTADAESRVIYRETATINTGDDGRISAVGTARWTAGATEPDCQCQTFEWSAAGILTEQVVTVGGRIRSRRQVRRMDSDALDLVDTVDGVEKSPVTIIGEPLDRGGQAVTTHFAKPMDYRLVRGGDGKTVKVEALPSDKIARPVMPRYTTTFEFSQDGLLKEAVTPDRGVDGGDFRVTVSRSEPRKVVLLGRACFAGTKDEGVDMWREVRIGDELGRLIAVLQTVCAPPSAQRQLVFRYQY